MTGTVVVTGPTRNRVERMGQASSCQSCGSMVGDDALHTAFHAMLADLMARLDEAEGNLDELRYRLNHPGETLA
jgi:hypothetical protein